jgi:hypothetical protein
MEAESLSRLFYLVPLLMVPWYFALSYALARISGWSRLAEKYKWDALCANSKGWQWGMVGGIGYRTLSVGLSAGGLYINTGPILLGYAFHPTLRIPWSAVESIEEQPHFWMQVLEIRIIGSNTTIRFFPKTLDGAQPYLGDKLKLSIRR